MLSFESKRGEGPLIISPTAFAELSPSASSASQLVEFLTRLAIRYDSISPASAYLAGATFKQYRKAGSPREHLVPDFLIAAHAQCQADRLASTDRGYLRKWFPNLVVVTISDGNAKKGPSLSRQLPVYGLAALFRYSVNLATISGFSPVKLRVSPGSDWRS